MVQLLLHLNKGVVHDVGWYYDPDKVTSPEDQPEVLHFDIGIKLWVRPTLQDKVT